VETLLPSQQEIHYVVEVEVVFDRSLLVLKEVVLCFVALQGDKEAMVGLVLKPDHKELLGANARCLADMSPVPSLDFCQDEEICIASHKYSSAGTGIICPTLFLGTRPRLGHVDREGHLEA